MNSDIKMKSFVIKLIRLSDEQIRNALLGIDESHVRQIEKKNSTNNSLRKSIHLGKYESEQLVWSKNLQLMHHVLYFSKHKKI